MEDILLVVGVGLVVILTITLFDWMLCLFIDTSGLRHPNGHSRRVRLVFEQFTRLYVATPTSWDINRYRVTYCGDEYYDVAFSLYSAWKYRRWWRNKERRAAQINKLQDQADFITDVRTALAQAEAQHKADMRKKLNSLWD